VRKNAAQTASYARGAPCPPPQSNPFPRNRSDSSDDRGVQRAQTAAANGRGERNNEECP